MAVTNLGQPTWSYDDETGLITGVFIKGPPEGLVDPLNWHPTESYIITFANPVIPAPLPDVVKPPKPKV